jgi:hypothetical protein
VPVHTIERDLPRAPAQASSRRTRRWLLAALLLAAALTRLSYLAWDDPYGPHQADEHFLPLEALAMWEGVAPREMGWPGSTSRLLLSTVYAGRLLLDTGSSLTQGSLDERLAVVSRWIGAQWADRTALYASGRLVSAIVGMLYLAVTWWALRLWLPWRGAYFGTAAAVLSPLIVGYSQFVLADVMGLLWATVVLGCVRLPCHMRVIAGAAVAAGLAAGSKFHLGVWLLAILVQVFVADTLPLRQRLRLSLLAIVVCGLVIILLVPWLWTNPALALKEFAGVVLVKIGSGNDAHGPVSRAAIILAGLGPLALVGAVLGLVPFARAYRRHAVIVLAPALVALAALAYAEIVFERYGLVLAPAICLLAGAGWNFVLSADRAPRVRQAGALAAAVALVWSVVTVTAWWGRVSEASADRMAAAWLVQHVEPGSTVALHSDANAFVPRTREDLQLCESYVFTPDAYLEKWASNGVQSATALGQPMRNAVLNDELFASFWCSRELLVTREDTGFRIVRFHSQPRFGAVLTRQAEHLFDRDDGTPGVSVLVMNAPRLGNPPPTAVLRAPSGARFIYARPDALR